MFLKEAQLLKRCDANKSLCLVYYREMFNVKFGKNRKHWSQQSWANILKTNSTFPSNWTHKLQRKEK